MATRGAKPKPARLRVVSGTHRADRHGDAAAVEERAAGSAEAFGPLRMPADLTGDAAEASLYGVLGLHPDTAHWLDASREAAAIAFCELWAEFRGNPLGFIASRHGQLRAYMNELGLTDERNRRQERDGKTADPAARYLG